MSTRSLGQASASASNWFWNFIVSRFTPQMFQKMGKNGCGVFFFFAAMMLASIVFVWFLVPETKAIPLEHMDRLFEIRPARKANKMILAENQARGAEAQHDAESGLSATKDKLAHYEQREL
jgi:hypothetical protein